MKNTITLSIAAAAALVTSAFGADYSVFRICEDQRVIRTSDGAEVGHVEYIVVDPSSQRIVSSVVTGGVIGEKFVAVPFSSMQFGADRNITLTEITRERIVSAPVVERTQLTSATVIRPDIIDRTNQHFGVRADATVNTNVRQENRADRSSRDANVSERAARMRNDSDRGADKAAARDENANRVPDRSRDLNADPSERSRSEENTGAARRNRMERETQNQAEANKREPNKGTAQRDRSESENRRSPEASEFRASGTGTGSSRERPAASDDQSGAARENQPTPDSSKRSSKKSSLEQGSQPSNQEMPAPDSGNRSANPQSSPTSKEPSSGGGAATPSGANRSSTPERENTGGSR